MKMAMRIAALFMAYSAIGAGGDYAVGLLFAQNDHAFRYTVDVEYEADSEFEYEYEYEYEYADEVDVHVAVDVDVDPEVVVDVVARNGASCRYEQERRVETAASAADLLSIDVASGELRVEGRRGLDRIEVVAAACASHEELLDELQVTLDRSSGAYQLVAHYPSTRGWSGSRTAKIDLTVLVPLGMSMDIDDSSGSMEISGTGDLRIEDSSGEITVTGVDGSVWIDDGSGGVTVSDVTGDVEIEDGSGSLTVMNVQGSVLLDDGSGSIEVEEVGRNVIVDDDGSGSIRVSNVGGDFVVRDDGSGGIRHSGVEGRVDIPRRDRRGN